MSTSKADPEMIIEEIAMVEAAAEEDEDDDETNGDKTDVDKVYTMVTNLLQAAEGSLDVEKTKTETFYGVITAAHVCDICTKEFANISNLNRHLKKVHKEDVLSVRAKIRCPLCEFGCEFYGSLCTHLEESHSIVIEREKLSFKSEDAFFNWKKKLEKETKASFIKKCGRKKAKQAQIEKIYFYCHRSGEKLKRPTMGKRQMKAQGSCKMNSGCPAQIRVLKYNGESGKFPVLEVEFVKTHVGHTMDMRHIRLDVDEKAKLASQLANGVPLDRVLDSVKKPNENGAPTERIHLTTRKDLLNISKQFNIHNKNGSLDEDIASINLWVCQVHNSSSSPVLCYKPWGEMCDGYPTLNADDFLLGIMNPIQDEMLRRHGDNLICVDRSHVSTGYDFPLITLMVIDENNRVFPAAFMISNKQDENMMSVFFEQIKNKIQRVKPKVFMTDTGRVFYNSWKHTMGGVVEKLFCSWHVEQAWKKKIQLIKDVEEQRTIFQSLKMLLEDEEPTSFQEKMDALLCEWQAEETTKRFAKYFQQHFALYSTFWAGCHRKGCSNIANEGLADLHRRLKEAYFEDSLKVKKMDSAITSIMSVLREIEIEMELRTQSETEIILSGDHESEMILGVQNESEMALILDRHEQSKSILPDNVISCHSGTQPRFYLIKSPSQQTDIFFVHNLNETCECSFTCPHCSTCIHRYKCNCNDNANEGNLCKHIHAVADVIKRQIPLNVAMVATTTFTSDGEVDESNILVEEGLFNGEDAPQIMMLTDDQDLINVTAEDKPVEEESDQEQIVIRYVTNGDGNASVFNEEKKVLEDKAEQLLSKIKTCRSWDELNNIKHVFMPLESAVQMVMDTASEENVIVEESNNLQTYIVTKKSF